MANTENIEAKLCAYVDGELDAAGRAEIEQHLQTNPQHRKLMAELTRTRDLLRALPRESAPPDIAESLQGQLERSVLLDDSDLNAAASAGDMRIHINRWPQFTAVAAILLLAIGLAAVVYFVLAPSRQGPEFSLAKTERHAPASMGEATTAPLATADFDKDISMAKRASGDRATKEDADAVAEAKSSPSAAAKPAFKDSVEHDLTDVDRRMMANAALPDREKAAPAPGVGGNVMDAREIQNQLFNAGLVANQRDAKTGVEQSPLFVVVSTQDPAGTYQCVTNYLTENQIHWEQVTVPMPAPMTATQEATAMASRAGDRSVQLKSGAVAGGGSGGGVGMGSGSGGSREGAEIRGKIAEESAKQSDVPTAPMASNAAANQGAAVAPAPAPGSSTTAPAATTPESAQALARNDANESIAKDEEQKAQMRSEAKGKSELPQQPIAQSDKPQQQLQQQQSLADNGTVYVARKMTRQQAVDLKASLARSPIQQHAAVIDNTETSASPAGKAEPQRSFAMKATDGAYQRTNTNAPPAIAPNPAPTTSITSTQPAEQATTLESPREINGVAADTAGGPSTQPATAAPSTNASSIAAPTTTTAPSGGQVADSTTTAPTSQSAIDLAGALPTTPPTATTQQSDEPVDVVIVVQNAPPPENASSATESQAATAPNPEPATAPATAPLAQ